MSLLTFKKLLPEYQPDPALVAYASRVNGVNCNPSNWVSGFPTDQGYNLIRVHIRVPDESTYNTRLDDFRSTMLPDVEALGIDFVLNLGHDSVDLDFIEEKWYELIAEFDDHPQCVGYDLVNEPNPADEYKSRIYAMVHKLRERTNKFFIVQPGPGTDLDLFDVWSPIRDNNVIYAPHMYWPPAFTHQGLTGYETTGQTWPGTYFSQTRDIDDLVTWLQPAVDFQDAYGVPMLIGEMGVSLYAGDTDADQWLSDVTSIREAHGWGKITHHYPPTQFRLDGA